MRCVRDHYKPRVGRLAGDASGMSSVSRSPTMTSTGIVSADNGRGSGQAGAPSLAVSSPRARRGMAVAWARDLHTARRLERDATPNELPTRIAGSRSPTGSTNEVRHRLQMPEVGRGGHHHARDHNVLLVGDGLNVLALGEPPQRFHAARLRSLRLTRPAGVARRRVGIRRAAEPAPVLHPPGPIALIRGAS